MMEGKIIRRGTDNKKCKIKNAKWEQGELRIYDCRLAIQDWENLVCPQMARIYADGRPETSAMLCG
jgi:hypothetical protein